MFAVFCSFWGGGIDRGGCGTRRWQSTVEIMLKCFTLCSVIMFDHSFVIKKWSGFNQNKVKMFRTMSSFQDFILGSDVRDSHSNKKQTISWAFPCFKVKLTSFTFHNLPSCNPECLLVHIYFSYFDLHFFLYSYTF